MDLINQHSISMQDGYTIADYLSFPLIGEVSSEGNARLFFSVDGIQELAHKISKGWEYAVAPPEILVLEESDYDCAKSLKVFTQLPVMAVVEGERRQRALLAVYLHKQKGEDLDTAAAKCAGLNFVELKNEFLKGRTKVYLQTIRLLSSTDINTKERLLLHMLGSNDKTKLNELEIAHLVFKLLGPQDPGSSVAYPSFNGKRLGEVLTDLCNTHNLLPPRKKLTRAIKFYGCSKKLWDAAIAETISIDMALNIAYHGDLVAKQGLKAQLSEKQIKQARQNQETYWVDRCLNPEIPLNYTKRDLIKELSGMDKRKKKEAEKIQREVIQAEEFADKVVEKITKKKKEPTLVQKILTPSVSIPSSLKRITVTGKGRNVSFQTRDNLPDTITLEEFVRYMNGDRS